MYTEILLPLATFCAITLFTPGPNNVMLMASGANYGLRRSVPHVAGIAIGHSFLVLIVGLGLAELFQRLPGLRLGMTVLAMAYLLWLAWKIAHAAAPGDAHPEARPLTFLQAAAFQWINPKGVSMAISAQTFYQPEGSGWRGAALVAGAFLLIGTCSAVSWAWGGTQVRRWLSSPGRLQAFNWTMAGLLVASMALILLL
ncbi:MAG: putative threonine efflux protein [Rhodobacteraceae bacterium HLUCCA08]|nr:MAG: putative threonine efflux protein [Rhodobacteraceae bacterium HLUCCA08]